MVLFFLLFLIIPTIFSCDSTVCKEAQQLLQNIFELDNSENGKDQLKNYFTDDFTFRVCDSLSIGRDHFHAISYLPKDEVAKVLRASDDPILSGASNRRFINFDIDQKIDARLNFQLSAKEVDGKLKIYKGHIITFEELANIQRTCDTVECSEFRELLKKLWKLRKFRSDSGELSDYFTYQFKFTECADRGGEIIDSETFYQSHVAFKEYIPKVFNATSYTLKTVEFYPQPPGDGPPQPPSYYETNQNARSFFSKNNQGEYFHLKAKEVDGVFKFYEGSCHQQKC